MEIRDPIHGTIQISDNEVQVIDSPAFQRLRAIKQLGFAEFSFPGAVHNRYIHSIGVCHLAGVAFDAIFSNYKFSSAAVKKRLRQVTRLGALLHDIGHGPLSHTTEEVMPRLSEVKVDVYKYKKASAQNDLLSEQDRQANHEDFTIKFLTDSPLTEILKQNFPDITPFHIACLVDRSLQVQDDFFIDGGVNFRTILSQLVSSELDVDRMDYLERDSYYCGTNYGRVELGWLLSNLTYHPEGDNLFLGLNRRALYTFDDFLISRHHMHLMVYFHHKSIIFEEMLMRYLSSKDCQFFLPADINEYILANDYSLYEHLAKVKNQWAERITLRKPFRVLFELHVTDDNPRIESIRRALENDGIEVIWASSRARLSKYHGGDSQEGASQIYVVDTYDRWSKPFPIHESTEIFKKYEETRRIERLYVAPENFTRAEKILQQQPM